MAKKKKNPTTVKGTQLDLMDVGPKNAQEIAQSAARYRAAQAARMAALKTEVEEKAKLLQLIRKGELQRLEDGKIQFTVAAFTITVTPRDELVQVKDKTEPGPDD